MIGNVHEPISGKPSCPKPTSNLAARKATDLNDFPRAGAMEPISREIEGHLRIIRLAVTVTAVKWSSPSSSTTKCLLPQIPTSYRQFWIPVKGQIWRLVETVLGLAKRRVDVAFVPQNKIAQTYPAPFSFNLSPEAILVRLAGC